MNENNGFGVKMHISTVIPHYDGFGVWSMEHTVVTSMLGISLRNVDRLTPEIYEKIKDFLVESWG